MPPPTDHPPIKYLIKNWDHFQHYRDRNPPWIKLHFELLSSSDWVSLDDASRVLAIACMLLASRSRVEKGEIDGSEAGLAYLKRVAYLNKPPNLNPLILCGFLVPASTMQATASTMQATAISEAYKERQILPCVSGEAPSHSEVVGLPQVASRKKAPADPNVKLIINHYYTSYLARFKSPPPIAGGKCGSVAKRLLAGRSLDDAKWLITAHLARAPEMYERKNLYGLEHVLHAAPILLARRAKEQGEDE